MGDRKVRKLQNRAKLGFILLFVDILFIAAIFNLDVPYFVMIIFLAITFTLAGVGMAIAIYYGIELMNKASEKTVNEVDEFVQKWELERWRKH